MAIHLNEEQSAALDAIRSFLRNEEQDAFILRGSAGTGKTTLIARLVDMLDEMHLSCALLAPTGRAARILGNRIKQMTGQNGHDARTIHGAIYTLAEIDVNDEAETTNDPGVRMTFPLRQEEPSVSLFVIDEASMVGDTESHGDFIRFGSGRLLNDVVSYARMARPGREHDGPTRLIFVGDPAQLPPVGEKSSPALSRAYLHDTFDLRVRSFDLNAVMRQAHDSAILDRATTLRDALLTDRFDSFSLQPDRQEIRQVDASTAVDLAVKSLRDRESGVTIVYSNARALDYNRSIRAGRWGDAGLPVQPGETLLVNRNSPIYPLSNGDLVKVMAVDAEAETVAVHLRGNHRVDLRFRGADVAFRAGDSRVIQFRCLILENLLDSPSRELTPLEQRALLVEFRKRHPDLNPKSDLFRSTIRTDPWFNAVQVKYGYAMTCHKAQGGEWHSVIVDFETNGGKRNAAFFRWAYTAITRATHNLIVVNPPDFDAVSTMEWAQPMPTPAAPAPAVGAEPDPTAATADPDWNRLSFSARTAPLMATHQTLRTGWAAQGIAIEQLQHLQYCERYTIARDGKRVQAQYHYDKKFKPGRAAIVPGASGDSQLTDDALAVMQSAPGQQDEAQPDQFIRDFLDRLDAAIGGSPISRTGYRSMPYRLRVSLSDLHRRGDIDFTYDGASTWTAAQEVGGPGSSHGLYEDLQRLMSDHAQ